MVDAVFSDDQNVSLMPPQIPQAFVQRKESPYRTRHECGVVPRFVQFYREVIHDPGMRIFSSLIVISYIAIFQVEAAWALTNIVRYRDHTQVVINAGAVPDL